MKKVYCLVLILLFQTSCGEIAYKRGASNRDLELAKKNCQHAGNEAAIDKCLQDNGWMMQKLDALGLHDNELFVTASVNTDNRMPNQAVNKQEETKEMETVLKEIKPNSSTSIQSETPASQTINPFEKYKINSWWKMGAGRNALESSISACSEKLGNAHQPDLKLQIFTRGFVACMYENGWRGLREK